MKNNLSETLQKFMLAHFLLQILFAITNNICVKFCQFQVDATL